MPRLPSQDPKAVPASTPSEEQGPPRPIGPERLRALREAILNGTYPTEGAVTGGLAKLFRQPAVSANEPAPPPKDA